MYSLCLSLSPPLLGHVQKLRAVLTPRVHSVVLGASGSGCVDWFSWSCGSCFPGSSVGCQALWYFCRWAPAAAFWWCLVGGIG